MIVFLKGEIISKDLSSLSLEVAGVGYGLIMSTRSLQSIGEVGDEVLVYTSLQPRENELSLYGFSTQEEREMFYLLISVTGIGPKVALSLLSSVSVPALQTAIVREDIALISSAPGLGKKTASRIVLELKDKFAGLNTLEEPSAPVEEQSSSNQAYSEAHAALLSMGFTQKELEAAFDALEISDDLKTEELVRCALARLSS